MISFEQFIQNLATSRLMSMGETSDFLDRFDPAQRPADTKSLVYALLQDQKLTKYQVNTLLSGVTKGLVFGEYLLLEKIGEGGMGHVFKAMHRRMERLAAVKVMSEQSLDSDDAVKRFHQEVRVAAKLSHPNIVATYDASEEAGVWVLWASQMKLLFMVQVQAV